MSLAISLTMAGPKYDATGALNNWWSQEDRRTFDARTACVVDQFNTLDVGGGQHHNGKQVLGEALGDLGGLSVAYRAYHRSLNGKEGAAIDGFTADQRFFIAFARVWGTQFGPRPLNCSSIRITIRSRSTGRSPRCRTCRNFIALFSANRAMPWCALWRSNASFGKPAIR